MWGCSTSAILFSIYIWSIICFEKWWFGVISPSLRSITKNDQSMPFWLKTQDWSFLASLFSHRYSRVGFSSSTNPTLVFTYWLMWKGSSTDPVVLEGVSQQILLFMEGDSDQDGFDPTIRSIFYFWFGFWRSIWSISSTDPDRLFPSLPTSRGEQKFRVCVLQFRWNPLIRCMS